MHRLGVFVAALTLVLLTGCCRTARPDPLVLDAEAVVGPLHAALSTINGMDKWDELRTMHVAAEAQCKEAKPDSDLCGKRDSIEAACKCSVDATCTPAQDAACATALAVRADYCAAERKERGKLYPCKVAASRRVPVFKHAEVTLNVARETSGEAGMSVLLFSAGQSQMYGGTQVLKFTLVPRPQRPTDPAADSRSLDQRLQIELRESLQNAVKAALDVMTADSFKVTLPNGNEEAFEPLVYAKEFAVTAEIVKREGNKFGLSWKDPSGSVGVTAGTAQSLGNKNQIVLVFAQEE